MHENNCNVRNFGAKFAMGIYIYIQAAHRMLKYEFDQYIYTFIMDAENNEITAIQEQLDSVYNYITHTSAAAAVLQYI